MRTRNIKIQCWLSENEYKAFDRAVKKSALSKSCYIRKLILGYAPVEWPKEIPEMLKKLFEISNTLNSIADGIAAHGFNADEYYKAYGELRDVTHKIFMEVMKQPKLKELKIDDGDEVAQTSENEK